MSGYSEDTETHAKKLARVMFWQNLRKEAGASFANWRVLVIAGPLGGDIGPLLALGVSPRRIDACDIVRSHALSCARRWPEVRVHHASAEQVAVSRPPGWYDMVFLDFPGTIAPPTSAHALRTFHRGVRNGGVAAVGFSYGRDTAIAKTIIKRQNVRGATSLGLSKQQRLALLHETIAHGYAEHVGGQLVLTDAFFYFGRAPMMYARWRRDDDGVENGHGSHPEIPVWVITPDQAKRVRDMAVQDARAIGSRITSLLWGVPEATMRAWLAVDTRTKHMARAS